MGNDQNQEDHYSMICQCINAVCLIFIALVLFLMLGSVNRIEDIQRTLLEQQLARWQYHKVTPEKTIDLTK
jgi:hypothetical protein